MSDNSCGHCTVIGAVAGGTCSVASKALGPVGRFISGKACKAVATVACEKISHCSTTNSANWHWKKDLKSNKFIYLYFIFNKTRLID